MIIKLLVEGGNMKPGPAISQKLGPLGINIGKVIQEVNQATQDFKGLKVPVELDVDVKKKQFQVHVSSPPVSELIKKELGIEKASGEQKKIKVGNLAIEQIIKITKNKYSGMLASNLKTAVKSVVGSCVSLGVLVEGKEAKEIEKEIVLGKYDAEISSEKTEVDREKQQKLKTELEAIKEKQEEAKKKEEAEKAEKEAKAEEKPAEKKEEKAGEAKPGKEAGKQAEKTKEKK